MNILIVKISVSRLLFHFMIFDICFFPILRADILSSFKLGDDVVVKTEVFDSISPYVYFFYIMKNFSLLDNCLSTLSLRIAVYILIFINLSTPFKIPLKVYPDLSSIIALDPSANLMRWRGNCIFKDLLCFCSFYNYKS